jgi:hypothetical protein
MVRGPWQAINRLTAAIHPSGCETIFRRRRRIPPIGGDKKHLPDLTSEMAANQVIDPAVWLKNSNRFHRQNRIEPI